MASAGFHVGWTPLQKIKPQTQNEIVECKLAPFSSTAKVNFVQVPVGSTANLVVYMTNPGRQCVSAKLSVSADFKAAGFQVSSEDMTIDPDEVHELIVSWRPIQQGNHCFMLYVTTDLPRVKSAVQVTGSAVLSKKTSRKKERPAAAIDDNTYNVLPQASPMVVSAAPRPSIDRKTFTIDSFERVLPQQDLHVIEDLNASFEPMAMPLDLSKAGAGVKSRNPVVSTLDKENIRTSSPLKQPKLELSFGHGFEEQLLSNLTIDRECLKSIENLSVLEPHATKSSTPMRVMQSPTRSMAFSPTPVKPELRHPSSGSGAGRHLLFQISPPKPLLDSGIVKKIKNGDDVKHQISVHSLSPKSVHTFKKPQTHPVKPLNDTQVKDLYGIVNSQQLNELIAWMNSLLSPLRELMDEPDEGADVTKAWQQVSRGESDASIMAVARDDACRFYHIGNNERRITLVKAAAAMYRSENISVILNKLRMKIQSGFLEMKDDRDVLYDSGDRTKFCNLIMKYSPIWLTICLEAMFDKPIKPSGNGLRASLVNFIHSNLLDDRRTANNKSQFYTKYRTPAFKKKMNESVIIKFISLVFFLDYAKTNRLIPFDPCLFAKNSPIKDSEAMLNEFIRDFIKCATRMKQTFNSMGICLSYKQSALDEYDMLVKSHLDLRDGVRLARLLEIIFKNCNLSTKLRVPPVSRLQKIHNIKEVLSALEHQGINISENITPGDVVDGHREKITSFVWQILHKFLLPKKEAAARVVQRWWRSFPVRVKVKMENKKRLAARARTEHAAARIQSWWRGITFRKRQWEKIKAGLDENRSRRDACIKIQRWYRAHRFLKACHAWVLEKQMNARRLAELTKLEEAVRFIQAKFRAKKQGFIDRREFLVQRIAALKIQFWYRAHKSGQRERDLYLRIHSAAILIQRQYRARKLGSDVRAEFLRIRSAVTTIQRWYRTVKCRKGFLELRAAAVSVQIQFRSRKLGRAVREEYLNKKAAAVKIQNWYRAVVTGRRDRRSFSTLKLAALTLQRKFRAVKLGRAVRANFMEKRSAAVKIQRWYFTQKSRKRFLELRRVAQVLQARFRLHKTVRLARKAFLNKRSAIVKIQNWYRSILKARRCRQEFLRLKQATLHLQVRFRARQTGHAVRHDYLTTRSAVISVQRWYRSCICRKQFLELKSAVLVVQTRYRHRQVGRAAVLELSVKRRAVVTIQRWIRSRKEHLNYLRMKQVTLELQRRFRARMVGRVVRSEFLKTQSAIVRIQRWHIARKTRIEYLKLKKTVVLLQSRFRERQHARTVRQEFLNARQAAMKIQNWYRSLKTTRNIRQEYLRRRQLTIQIQRKFRARSLGRSERSHYLQLRATAVTLQRWYRARRTRRRFLVVKSAALTIQTWFRNQVACRAARRELREKREAALRIHQIFSMNNPADPEKSLSSLVRATMRIQQWYRGIKLVREARRELHQRQINRNKAMKFNRREPHKKPAHKHDSTYSHHSIYTHDSDGFICPCRAQTKRHKAAATRTLRDKFNACLEQMSLRNQDPNDIVVCCKNLDYITDHSSLLCEELIAHPGALRFIWSVINKESRTEQQQDIICSAFNIFINLSLYTRTKEATWQAFLDNDGCGIVLSLMGKYVSKQTPIFCKAATFLWLLIHNDRTHLQFVKTYKDCLKTLAFYLKKISPPKATQQVNDSFLSPFLSLNMSRHSYRSRTDLNLSTASTSSQASSSSQIAVEPASRHKWGYAGSGSTKEFQTKKTALLCLNSFLRFLSM